VKPWRVLIAALVFFAVGVPVGLPLLQLLRQPDAWHAWDESSRQLHLLRNTLTLLAGTLAVALPLGILAAVLLYRSDLPARSLFRFLTILTLFVPLPLFASAWQATLGAGGWLGSLGWWSVPSAQAAPGWQPWTQGMASAIWVHAMAGLPWVVWLVGQGLCWVERELEEEALLAASPWQVLFRVTLPRCRAAIGTAALVVAIQTATEITVTDVMMVRTFAEEVYLQFLLQGRDVLASAAAVCLLSLLIVAVLVVGMAGRWERRLPALEQVGPPVCLFPLGKARLPVLLLVTVAVGFLAGVPLLGLVWKTGLGGSPVTWSAGRVMGQLEAVATGKAGLILESMFLGGCVGVATAGLALVVCWLAVESAWFRVGMLIVLAVALAMPGPVVGFGLKETIDHLLAIEEAVASAFVQPLRFLLYDGPSMLPVVWVSLVRFLPVAVAVLWPAVRLLPTELRDAARVDGARPVDELTRVVFPLTRRACLRAALAVGVLSLGELSAGKLVETPGSTTLAHVIFEQMHRGVPGDVAALCLVLLLTVAGGGALVALIGREEPV
jgi:iron(III) transport system permease protein